MRIHINFVSFVCLFLFFFFSLFFCLPPIIYVCPLTNINHTQKNEKKNTHVSLMQEKALFGSFYGSSLSNNNNAFYSKNTQNHNSLSNGANLRANHVETTTTLTWAFQAVPTLYSVYQKVEYHKKIYIYTQYVQRIFFFMLFYKSKKSSFTIYDTLTLTILLHFVSVYFIFFSFFYVPCVVFHSFLLCHVNTFILLYIILLCRFI